MARGSNSRQGRTARSEVVASAIAERVHATQKRRTGEPYMTHIKEVVDGVSSPEAKMVAYLHDTMEDGGITTEQLRAEGIPERVIEAVNALTRPPAEERQMTYQEYIEQVVKPNELAREVKIADLRSNLRDNDNPGQVKRYRRALEALTGEKPGMSNAEMMRLYGQG